MTSHHFFPMLLFSVAQTSFASRGSWATVSSPAFQERCRPFALLDLSAVHDLATQLNDLSTNLATIPFARLADYTDTVNTVSNTHRWSMYDLDNFSRELHDLATQLNDLSTNLATIEVRVDNLVIFAVSYIFIAVGTFFFEELLGFFSDW